MQTAEVMALKQLSLSGIWGEYEKHEDQILQYGLEKLRKDNSVNIIGNPKTGHLFLSFTIKRLSMI